jgi:hypothetical protein
MGKSYRRHHKRPKRKNTRRRRGGADEDAPKSLSSFSMSDMYKHINKAYESGVKSAQPHVDRMNKMATDLHKQAYEQGYSTGKKAYTGFKYSGPTNFAIAKTGESAYSSASSAAQPHIQRFSSLFTKQPSGEEVIHAQQQAKIGTPMQNDPINMRNELN